ncbi:MAG: M16 family metallopeptidase [Planctomycetota bacterium]|jgi:zinc protease
MHRIRAFALLFLTAALFAADADLEKALPIDPQITRGEMPNGMRYWIRPNKTPAGKVSIMMHVHSGSLNEAEDQRGLAHFLEHMAFNGSEHFPPGEMVKFFESLGMRFGQHQNAFTGFDQTTYMMHLPDTKKETLDKVFLYFADVGWRLKLLPEEIKKERGVILEEARTRKGSSQRIMEKAMPIFIPGSRLPDRMPIGLESVVKEAEQDRFLAYYTKWYRPENTTMVVVGDIDPAAMKARIESSFSDWKRAKSKATAAEPGIVPHSELRAAVITDPELTQTRIGLGAISPMRSDKTVGDFRRGLVDSIGVWIVNRRLRQRIQKGDAPYLGASVSSGEFLNACHSTDIDASGDPAKWQEMLTAVLVEVRKARVHGFTDSEIELARKTILSGAEQAAQAAPTTNTTGLVMALNTAVTAGRMPMSPAQGLGLTQQLLPGISSAEAAEAFRSNFLLDRGVVMATMPEKEGVKIPSDAELLAVAKKAITAEVEKAAEEEGGATLLAKLPEPAKPVSTSLDKGLDIETVIFPNGARVHCRTMDFRKDAVMVMVRFVGGGLDETVETAHYTSVAALAYSRRSAATKRLSSSQLSDLMTGKKVGFGGAPDDEGFGFTVGGSPEDLEFGLQVMHALLTEPKIEKVSFDRWKRRTGMMLPEMQKSSEFQAAQAVVEMLSANDPRVGRMTAERLASIELAPVQAWLEKLLATAPIEVAFVGDMPRDKMVALASRYIGTLPKRAVERADLDTLRVVKQNKGPMEREVAVDTITPRAQVQLGWRGAAIKDRVDRRILLFTSQILSTRLNAEIREKRSLTYSIDAGVRPGAYDGLGRLMVQFTADPDKAAEAAQVARKVVEDMKSTTPPTDEEITAIKTQLKNILGTQLQQPSFWAQTLTTLLTNKRSLDQLRDLEKDYQSVTKEQIKAMLAKYVVDERFFKVIAAPKK